MPLSSRRRLKKNARWPIEQVLRAAWPCCSASACVVICVYMLCTSRLCYHVFMSCSLAQLGYVDMSSHVHNSRIWGMFALGSCPTFCYSIRKINSIQCAQKKKTGQRKKKVPITQKKKFPALNRKIQITRQKSIWIVVLRQTRSSRNSIITKNAVIVVRSG